MCTLIALLTLRLFACQARSDDDMEEALATVPYWLKASNGYLEFLPYYGRFREVPLTTSTALRQLDSSFSQQATRPTKLFATPPFMTSHLMRG
jgi:hypothetical protein